MKSNVDLRVESFPFRGKETVARHSRIAFGVLTTGFISDGVIANVKIPVEQEFAGKVIKISLVSIRMRARATKSVTYRVVITNEWQYHWAGENPKIPAALSATICGQPTVECELLHFWGDGTWGVTGLWDAAPQAEGYTWGSGTWGVTGLWDTQTSGAHVELHSMDRRFQGYIKMKDANPEMAIILGIYGPLVQHNTAAAENTVEIHYEIVS